MCVLKKCLRVIDGDDYKHWGDHNNDNNNSDDDYDNIKLWLKVEQGDSGNVDNNYDVDEKYWQYRWYVCFGGALNMSRAFCVRVSE